MRQFFWIGSFLSVAAGGALLAAQQPTPSPIVTPSAVPSQDPPASPPAKTSRPTTPLAETTPGQQVDLRPKFRTGQVIKYLFDQTAHNKIASQDATDNSLDQDQKQTECIGLTFKVVQAGDEGATIQVVYDSIKVSLTTPDGLAEYDSAKPAPKKPAPTSTPATTPSGPRTTRPGAKPTSPTPPPTSSDPLKDIGDMDMNGMLGQIVGPMVGTIITVKTDRTGAITSVSGGDALGGGLGGLGGLGAAGVVPSPSAMANWLVAGMGGKPGARIGESWTNNDSLAGTPVGSFAMKTTHTLKSASGGVANVAFVGGIEPSSESPQTPGGLAQVQSASYTGTYGWDTTTGSLRDMTTDMRVSLDGGTSGVKLHMASETQIKVHRQ